MLTERVHYHLVKNQHDCGDIALVVPMDKLGTNAVCGSQLVTMGHISRQKSLSENVDHRGKNKGLHFDQ